MLQKVAAEGLQKMLQKVLQEQRVLPKVREEALQKVTAEGLQKMLQKVLQECCRKYVGCAWKRAITPSIKVS